MHMKPYLKGLHITIDSWRMGRDEEGYRIPVKELNRSRKEQAILVRVKGIQDWRATDLKKYAPAESEDEEASERVAYPARFRGDVEALRRLTYAGEPPPRVYRATKQAGAVYTIGDASRAGFGSVLCSEGRLL